MNIGNINPNLSRMETKVFPEDNSVTVFKDGRIYVSDASRIFVTNRERYLFIRTEDQYLLVKCVSKLFKTLFRLTGITPAMEVRILGGDRTLFIPYSYIYSRTFIDKPEHLLHRRYDELVSVWNPKTHSFSWVEIG